MDESAPVQEGAERERLLSRWRELRRLEKIRAVARYRSDPIFWIHDRLREFTWSKQQDILRSVVECRRTAVPSCFASGKALALDTPIPTPEGWSTMGALCVGDTVIDEQGHPCRITAVSAVESRETYEVTFSDGTSIHAADTHQWAVLSARVRSRLRGRRRSQGLAAIADYRALWGETEIKTTAELAASVRTKQGWATWGIPTARSLSGGRWPLRIGPYTFGVWLGDGTTREAAFTCAHVDAPEILASLAEEGTVIRDRVSARRSTTACYGLIGSVQAELRAIGALGTKAIPESVLRADRVSRLAVLQGLMDTDGYAVPGRSAVGIEVTNARLADGIAELVRSLGWVAHRSQKSAKLYGRTVGTVYRVLFAPDEVVFRLRRKAKKWRLLAAQRCRNTLRTIVAVKAIGRQRVKCIEVDSPSRLYLAGRGWVPTHNSWLAARVVAWWVDSHPVGTAFAVTTATTGSQVEAILWRELGRAHAAGRLPGRLNKKEWYCPTPDGDREEMVAFGRKPADMDSTAFQGIHAQYVLVVLDEAAGVPKAIFDAAEGLIANEESRILAIGNPEQAASPFQEACRPGSGWNVIKIPAFCTPNFTGESVPEVVQRSLVSALWVEEKRRSWGEENPLWKAKVEAEFPDVNENGLIPISWIRAAQDRVLSPGEPVEIGMDVGAGGDRSVICVRRGPVAKIVRRSREPDTMKSCGALLSDMKIHRVGLAKVDEIGVGRGVVDRAMELGRMVRGVNVGMPSSDTEAFANLRAEGYWALRERFRAGDIALEPGPETEDLVAQLVDIQYKRTSRGQIQIESKEEMKRRGRPSPDEADALMLAFIQPEALGSYAMSMQQKIETAESELMKLRAELGLSS